MKDNWILYLGVIVLFVIIIIFFPLAVVWALNTLFGLGIAYTFWTWLAVVIINLTWAGGLSHGKSK